MYRLLIGILVFVSIAGGCGGSNSAPPTPPPPLPTVGSDNLGDANSGRLLPTGEPGTVGVGGEFSVQDFNVLDVPSPNFGSVKLLARLLDPGDDILSEVIPGLDGGYELYTTEAITHAKVQLEFRVEEDVDGDGQGNDLVVHTVPVLLVPGFVSKLSMSIAPGSVHNVAPVLWEADNPVGPEPASSVVVGVERLDGNGEYDEFFALFPDGLLYLDENNDEFFEPGIDSFWDDSDRNGWPDLEEPGYDDFGNANWRYLEGTVTSVNTAAQTLFLFVEFAETLDPNGAPDQDLDLVGKSVQVRKLSYTVMEGMLLPSDPGTTDPASPEDIGFTDPFLIDDSLVGRTVIVQGLYDGSFVDAELIFELSPEPGLPAGGF